LSDASLVCGEPRIGEWWDDKDEKCDGKAVEKKRRYSVHQDVLTMFVVLV
jgi:hypothetical protein